MFSKIVAIEPVSLIPSAEEALHTFANEVVMYPDIPADDEEIVRRHRRCRCGAAELYFEYPPRGNGKMSQYQIYRHVLFCFTHRKAPTSISFMPTSTVSRSQVSGIMETKE